MANRDNPSGFRPVRMLTGANIPVWRFPVYASNTYGLYMYDLASALATGNIQPSAADCGDIMLGAVVGIYDSNEIPVGAWNSSTSTKYLAASTAGYADIALALPEAIFRAQAITGSGPAATDLFSASDHTAGTGSTTTGISGHELTGTWSSANMWKLIGLVDEPGNAWGEYADLLVVAEESYWHDGTAGV